MDWIIYVVIANFLKSNDFYYHLIGCFSSLKAAMHAGEQFANDYDRTVESENWIYDVDQIFLIGIDVNGIEINKIHKCDTCMYRYSGAIRKWSKDPSYDRIVKDLLHTEDTKNESSNS